MPNIRLFRGTSVGRILCTLLAVSFLPVGQSALAQDGSSETVEEIVVSVRRRKETIKDVPATVYVFTESDIERSNITRAADIALLTPGVSLVDAAEVGDTQVNIRGMNGARDAENSYALVIDGITMTNPAALNREYANLQQIEVLKGPQGAIYGRNASAGAFVITTKTPGDEMQGSMQASAAEDATYYLNGAISGPLAGGLSGGLNAEYRTSDGFFNNQFLDKDDITDNIEDWSVTGRLVWEATDDLSFDTKLRYGEVDASSIAFNNTFALPDLATAFNQPFFYEDVNDHDFVFYNNIIHVNEQEALEFSVKMDLDMEWATLTAWGLYSDIENQLGADGTSAAFNFFNATDGCIATTTELTGYPVNQPQYIGLVPGFPDSLLGAYTPTTCDGTQYQRRNQDDLSFEVRLTSPSDQSFRWNAGLYYLDIDREVVVNTGLDDLTTNPGDPTDGTGYQNFEPILSAFIPNGSPNSTQQLAWDDFDTTVYSAFGGIAYDFTDSLTADVALRYDYEDREVTNKVPTNQFSQYIDPCGNGGNFELNAGLCNNPGGIPDKQDSWVHWQPKVSLTWDITDQWTTYGSWGVGFRSGGFNNSGSGATVNNFINIPLGLCDPATPGCVESGLSRVGVTDKYDKETTSSFELGVKSNLLDNALRLEAAAYYTEVDDMQFFEFIVGGFGLLRVVENIDEVEIFGIEASATWNAASWLDLFIGANWNDTEINANTVRPDTVGNESPYTPEYTGNLGAYLSFPIGQSLSLFTNLDVSAIGDTWFHAVQDQTRPTGFGTAQYSVAQRDAYVLTNLRIGVETERWTAAAFATNLLDEDYLEEVIPAPEFGGSFIHADTERRIGADLTWRF